MAIYAYNGHRPTLDQDTYVHEQATLIGQVTLDAGASIWPQAVLRADNEPIHIGSGSNVQDGAVLHTDPGFPLQLGEGVTVGHQAMLHGCTVGENSLIGIQAVVLNGAKIGNNCLVGAGALVTEGKEFPDNSLIIGSPAKVVRELSAEAIAGLRANAQSYVDKGREYRSKLQRID
ncbi:MAG: gamma carbonic anhydrase family protein [Oceanospirillales bacterium]|uniref:Carbonic anhydrase/acetyltransferase-like protein (Isoleucine patch superfamily) n=1 Tax=Marinobacterium halophilum TaxID=267374 RepID=A0A2P8ERV4_9GAMM|nr:gamma carbonic anhydrase family protein [Marinobacterium halophilum]MBR9829800.1 gamma carbonic anhydrase family protein [Oceanospirillales bacterium]PSL12192.1 carbonic anhydrase/acetyltransferase-like protein (isoleucine patch superfamily) [Marinobacterium halophilum]